MSSFKVSKIHGALIATSLGCVTLGILTVVLAGEIKRPAIVDAGTYVSSDACKKCHFDSFRGWKKTKHAEAFDVLPDRYKADAACLPCHTTGHGQTGGFSTLEATPDLVGVQCEMCHGPGEAHTNYAKANEEKKGDPEVVAELKKLISAQSNSACWKCHLDQTHGQHPDFEK